MPDPITVGTIAAWVFAQASEAVVKDGVGEVVKDAYAKLKAKIASWASSDVEALASSPTSPGRRAVLAEAIDALPEIDRDAVAQLVAVLATELERNGPVGVVLTDLKDVQTHIRRLRVTSGTGTVLRQAEGGTIHIDEITVGPSPGK